MRRSAADSILTEATSELVPEHGVLGTQPPDGLSGIVEPLVQGLRRGPLGCWDHGCALTPASKARDRLPEIGLAVEPAP